MKVNSFVFLLAVMYLLLKICRITKIVKISTDILIGYALNL